MKQEKKGSFVPVGNTNRDKRCCQQLGQKVAFCPGCQTRDKRISFCPGLAFPVGKPGQQGFPNWGKLVCSSVSELLKAHHHRLAAARPDLPFHYYRKANLSRLENPCCPGFPTGNARPGQGGVLLSRVWQPGQKPGHPFFSCFHFLNSFSISIILLHFN